MIEQMIMNKVNLNFKDTKSLPYCVLYNIDMNNFEI